MKAQIRTERNAQQPNFAVAHRGAHPADNYGLGKVGVSKDGLRSDSKE